MRIIPETLNVRPEDARPLGKPGECFYCNTPMGEPHKETCVIPSKLVKVRLTIEYDISVPLDWKKDLIEFSRNEGSWCAGNVVHELQELKDANEGCFCDIAHFECIEDQQ